MNSSENGEIPVVSRSWDSGHTFTSCQHDDIMFIYLELKYKINYDNETLFNLFN